MTHGHHIAQCKHGTVAGQCRCTAPDKTIHIVGCPPSCQHGNTPTGPIVAGEPAAVRLMRALDYRLSPPHTRKLAPAEVAVVLHALADHTAIMAALRWRSGDEPQSPWWPEATSVGRWFHDVADQLERIERTDAP